eukprot:3214126-Prymnesium_polylepis.1
MSARDKPVPRIHHVAAVATPQQHSCVPRAGPAQRPRPTAPWARRVTHATRGLLHADINFRQTGHPLAACLVPILRSGLVPPLRGGSARATRATGSTPRRHHEAN